MNKTKKIFAAIFGLFLAFQVHTFVFVSPALADGSLLCNPEENSLFNCVNRLYTFSIVAASIAAVFMIVLAGYLYMFSGGSESKAHTAKSLITSSITGLIILVGGLLILKQINPDLLKIKNIAPEGIAPRLWQLPGGTVVSSTTRPPGAILKGGSGGGGGSCKVTTGSDNPCSVDRMKNCPAWQNQAELASKICNLESAGGRNLAVCSGSDVCTDGTSWSCGLFQINMIAHGGQNYMPKECPAGMFEKRGTAAQGTCLQRNQKGICIKYDCNLKAGQQGNYQACRQALANADVQMKIACGLYTRRGGWGDWQTSYNACK